MRLAFIGLGAIGLPIARRLALHPHLELSIYDTRPEVLEAEASLGRVAASVADAIADAEVIFTVLPADPHVRSVGEEIAAAGSRGQVLVELSTVAPSTIDVLAAQLDRAGVETLGGALMRSVAAAETGELSIFVGGRADLVEQVRPALEQMATEIRMVATAAAAKALKIVNNMVVSSLDLVICDALLVGARHGIEPGRLVDAIGRSGGESWPLRNHIEKHLLTDELAPGRFSIRYMGKDAALASRLAQDRGQPAWFAGMVNAAYRGTDALGYGNHYHPIVMRWLEHAASSAPVTPSRSAEDALTSEAQAACEALSRGVVAEQALITLDALRLIAAEGVATGEALDHFDAGSASNDGMRALRSGEDVARAAPPLSALVESLDAVCTLAAEVTVPAITFELGRNLALSLADLHGRGASPREIVMSRP
jgi:3-hydroxyisobutyrate dehydrogenase-like beta-hydroxyacid dehydrogenase